MNFRRSNNAKLWRLLAEVAVELMQRRDEFGQPLLLVRKAQGNAPEANIVVSLESARDKASPLVAMGNSTLSPRFVHHLTAFPVHPATVAAINRRAVIESRA